MGHRIQPFIQGMSAAGEELFYAATGTLSGVVGSETARDLQDMYINKPGIKMDRPGFNLKKWQKKYKIEYTWKRRFKGDVVIGETSRTQPETLRTDQPFYNIGKRKIGRNLGSGYRARSFSKRKFSNRRCDCKSCLYRRMAKSRRYRWR